ncbi:hypothetical protein VCHENC02_2610 [Vibrio harveyi]|uniref:Uncharacterized protein n=1 Tax=Vibrio harveyi TaxID=669 RepID=A0A454CZH6_VIBHA|nr:hypothetical protein VCHENC02_2610 [Vibrio harveyi]
MDIEIHLCLPLGLCYRCVPDSFLLLVKSYEQLFCFLTESFI